MGMESKNEAPLTGMTALRPRGAVNSCRLEADVQREHGVRTKCPREPETERCPHFIIKQAMLEDGKPDITRLGSKSPHASPLCYRKSGPSIYKSRLFLLI